MSTNDRPAQDEDHVMRAMRTAPIVEGDAAEQAAEEVGLRSIELAGLLPGLPDLIKFANEVADEEGAQYPAALGELARACELLLAEQADVTARPLAALRAAFSDVDPHSATVDMLEAHRAAAMWEARYREAEEAHARDAAVLKALRAEVERLRAPAPAGGADREAELDRIAAAQRERMGASAATVDLAAARAAAREARERAADVPPCEFSVDEIGANDDRTWVFAEIYSDFHKGRYLYLRAPADVVDTTPGECFAHAIMAARSDVPTLAAHVDTLANEAERLRARVAEMERTASLLRESRSKVISTLASIAAALDGRPASDEEPEIVRRVAAVVGRAAELERERAAAWTCTTCDTSGTAADLADDGNGPVCPQCRQARHLCMHGPAGWRVAALLAAAGAEVTDAQRLAHDSDDDRETIYQRGRHTGARIVRDIIADHIGAPSPLDVVVAEVCAVDVAAEVGPVTCMNDAYFKIDDLASVDGTEQDNWRDLVRIAAVALAGIRACDAPAPTAAKGGA